MTVTCNYRSTAVIILPGVYLPPQRNATVADDAFSLLFISIHAPREGSDACEFLSGFKIPHFNPRSPRGERRLAILNWSAPKEFQSTLPARGAIGVIPLIIVRPRISIHAPREGSDDKSRDKIRGLSISIHAPREGSDVIGRYCRDTLKAISIHAPREGSDSLTAGAFSSSIDFNPRSPRGERPRTVPRGQIALGYFNPRSPRGERLQQQHQQQQPIQQFQSTLPARGATAPAARLTKRRYDFNPRSPRGERHSGQYIISILQIFQSTLPARGAT